jgi:hypothetical protein
MKTLFVTPAQAGVHVPNEVDSPFRGNDVVGMIFRRASRLVAGEGFPELFFLPRNCRDASRLLRATALDQRPGGDPRSRPCSAQSLLLVLLSVYNPIRSNVRSAAPTGLDLSRIAALAHRQTGGKE